MNNESLTWEVLPTFSKPIANAKINDAYAMVIRDKLSDFTFLPTRSTDKDSGASFKSDISESLYVLDEMPEVKEYLSKLVNDYIYEILGYACKVKITTSWFTRIMPGGYCQYHAHSNCWFSGVLYFDDVYEKDCGNLIFWNDDYFFEVYVNEENIFNSTLVPATPEKNHLVIFPSQVKHRITKNRSPNARYSLAFNINPTGVVGYADNTIEL